MMPCEQLAHAQNIPLGVCTGSRSLFIQEVTQSIDYPTQGKKYFRFYQAFPETCAFYFPLIYETESFGLFLNFSTIDFEILRILEIGKFLL